MALRHWAQVYLNIMGSGGSSGEHPLLRPAHSGGGAFKRGGCDRFSVEAHYLGALTALLVGHDNSGRAHSRSGLPTVAPDCDFRP